MTRGDSDDADEIGASGAAGEGGATSGAMQAAARLSFAPAHVPLVLKAPLRLQV